MVFPLKNGWFSSVPWLSPIVICNMVTPDAALEGIPKLAAISNSFEYIQIFSAYQFFTFDFQKNIAMV